MSIKDWLLFGITIAQIVTIWNQNETVKNMQKALDVRSCIAAIRKLSEAAAE